MHACSNQYRLNGVICATHECHASEQSTLWCLLTQSYTCSAGAVLGSAGLGALLPVLERARIGSLASLRCLSLDGLQRKLAEAGGSTLVAAQRQRLSTLGLCADVVAPRAAARMERV